jgi:ubiquinone/menaquinone biosynthesis C-methylase UbiE
MFEQVFYSLTRRNCHFQNVRAELQRLAAFLRDNDVHAADIVDVGCGDGAITIALGALLDARDTWGIDLNSTLLARAARMGVNTVCQDMTCLDLERTFELVVSYGSLHHVQDTNAFVRGLARLSSKYVLIVDNTVRPTYWHRLTGSRYFPLESSSYPIRTVQEIMVGLTFANCLIIDVLTTRNANLWHDRSFVLAAIEPGKPRLAGAGCRDGVPGEAVQEGHRDFLSLRPSRERTTRPTRVSSTAG